VAKAMEVDLKVLQNANQLEKKLKLIWKMLILERWSQLHIQEIDAAKLVRVKVLHPY